jgi:hypothetical protein
MDCSSVYCGVKPHALARLTTRQTLPLNLSSLTDLPSMSCGGASSLRQLVDIGRSGKDKGT